MNKKIIFGIIKKFNYLIWLLLFISFTIFVTYFYDRIKNNQIRELIKMIILLKLEKNLKHIFLKRKEKGTNVNK